MEVRELTSEEPVSHGLLDMMPYYYQEIGPLNIVLIFATLTLSLTIALRTKGEDKEKKFRSISTIGILGIGWLVFDMGRDLVSCFNYSTIDGRMPLELVLTDVGKRAFQIQAIAFHMIITGSLLLLVHLKKPKV